MSNIITGKYHGLNYKFNQKNGTMEFTKGKMNWNGGLDPLNAFIPTVGAPDLEVNGIQHIQHIKFDKGVDTSHVTNMSSMFNDSSAKDIEGLNHFDTSNVKDMQGMFYCSQAKNLDVSHFDTHNVKDMFYMFCDSQAKNIKGLNHFNTSNVKDMRLMFAGSQAKNINVGNNKRLRNELKEDRQTTSYLNPHLIKYMQRVSNVILQNDGPSIS